MPIAKSFENVAVVGAAFMTPVAVHNSASKTGVMNAAPTTHPFSDEFVKEHQFL